MLVITDKDERQVIIKSSHEGLAGSVEAQSLAGHFGRDKTIGKITERYYKYSLCLV